MRVNTMLSRYTYTLLILVFAVGALPSRASDLEHEITQARTIFLQGVDGDKLAVRKALQRYRKLMHRQPENPVFLAYLGATISLKGRDAPNNLDKQRLTEQGLVRVDQALDRLDIGQDAAQILETKLVAADTFIYIPAFFNRYQEGQRLLHEIIEDRHFANMAAGFKAATYFSAAIIARGKGRTKEYLRYLDLCIKTDPDGRDGRNAKALLESL